MNIDSFRLFLIILICLVILVLIIIGIVLLVKYYKRSKKIDNIEEDNTSEENAPASSKQKAPIIPIIGNNNTNNHIIKTSVNEYLSKEKKINAFCNCFLKPIKYSLVKIYNESCPIDLIPFTPDDEISVTKCKHGFHFNCIKKYLLENEDNKELKCPLCLKGILEININ